LAGRKGKVSGMSQPSNKSRAVRKRAKAKTTRPRGRGGEARSRSCSKNDLGQARRAIRDAYMMCNVIRSAVARDDLPEDVYPVLALMYAKVMRAITSLPPGLIPEDVLPYNPGEAGEIAESVRTNAKIAKAARPILLAVSRLVVSRSEDVQLASMAEDCLALYPKKD